MQPTHWTRRGAVRGGATLLAATALGLAALLPMHPARAAEGAECPPLPDPASFVAAIDNQYFPLVPGTTYRYEENDEEETTLNVVEVTHETRVVMGVTTTVVLDTAMQFDGELIEQTWDWYAQDAEGNVWYFGEESRDYDDGEFAGTEGSWEAGVDGAQPGIIMKGHPQVGDTYLQECAPGEAEDTAAVLAFDTFVTSPYAAYTNALLTAEWNPLEPDSLEHKYFVPGVGLVRAETVEDDPTEEVLVELTRPNPAARARGLPFVSFDLPRQQ